MLSAEWVEGDKNRQERPRKVFMQKCRGGMVVDCSWGEDVEGSIGAWITYIFQRQNQSNMLVDWTWLMRRSEEPTRPRGRGSWVTCEVGEEPVCSVETVRSQREENLFELK